MCCKDGWITEGTALAPRVDMFQVVFQAIIFLPVALIVTCTFLGVVFLCLVPLVCLIGWAAYDCTLCRLLGRRRPGTAPAAHPVEVQ